MTETIVIRIVQEGADRVARGIDRVGKAARRGADAQVLLNRALIALGSTRAVRELLRLADASVKIGNTIGVVTNSTGELVAIQKELFEISNRTRTPVEANAELFRRLALSTQELGTSQQRLLNVTELVNKAIIISGSSAQEAEAGLIQLSQGIAAGALRGDELRSVLEQLPFVTQVIQDELGLTRGDLRDFAAEGGITAKVILESFENSADRINGLFAETTPTIEQSLTILRNKSIEFIQGLNQQFGVVEKITNTIQLFANNLDLVAKFAGVAGTAISSILVARGIKTAISAVKALTLAVAANPLGALFVIITTVTAALLAFGDEVSLTGDGLTTLGDVAKSALNFLKIGFTAAFDAAVDFAKSIGIELPTDLRSLLKDAAKFADRFVGVFVGIANVVAVLVARLVVFVGTPLAAIFAVIKTSADAIKTLFAAIVTSFTSAATAIELALSGNFDLATGAAQNAVDSLLNGVAEATRDLDDKIVKNFDIGLAALGPAADLAGQDLGDAFFDGFNRSGFQDALDVILEDADKIGEKRREAAAAAAEAADLSASGPSKEEQAELARTLGFLAELNLTFKEQSRLIGLNSAQREVAIALSKIESDALANKVVLEKDEIKRIKEKLFLLQAEERQAALLQQLTGAEAEFQQGLGDIAQLLKDTAINAETAEQAYLGLRSAFLGTQTDVVSGIEKAFVDITLEANNFAAQAEKVIKRAFDNATTALVNFAKTGKLNFKELASSIIDDLLRIAAKQILVGLIPGADSAGGVAGAIAGALGFGPTPAKKQAGGPVSAGKPVFVGEQGPELFVPPSQGNIIPNKPTEGLLGGRPEVNVTVVNVESDERIASAMDTPMGEEVIMNTLRKNRRGARQLLRS